MANARGAECFDWTMLEGDKIRKKRRRKTKPGRKTLGGGAVRKLYFRGQNNHRVIRTLFEPMCDSVL